MLIYKIALNSHKDTPPIQDFEFRHLQSSHFSFITSIRIAAECKRVTPDAIFTYCPKDAMAALSARKIDANSNHHYPIFLIIESGTKIPISLHPEVAQGIDAIIYESETIKERWAVVKNLEKIRRTAIVAPPGDNTPIQKKEAPGPFILGYVGSLAHLENLSKMIDTLSCMPTEECPSIVVLGTAKARYITPLIRRAKANNLHIRWLGNDYEKEAILSSLHGYIPSGDAPSTLEKRLLANGIPEVTPDNLPKWLKPDTQKEIRKAALFEYSTKYLAEIYTEKIKELLNQTTKPL